MEEPIILPHLDLILLNHSNLFSIFHSQQRIIKKYKKR